jgi:hypothetical protein
MPRISYFYGITIAMYWDERDHQVAHFHAEYAGDLASIALDGTVLAGNEHAARKPSTQSHRFPKIKA